VSAELLDGKAQAKRVRQAVQEAVDELVADHDVRPRLDAILAGDNEASEIYVTKKQEDCEEVGITHRLHRFGTDVSTQTLVDHVQSLNADPDVDGMIVQLPLPEGVDEARVLEAVDPAKDADGFHPTNLGRLLMDRSPLTPATPTGILHLLEAYDVDLEGADVAIVGRSTIVGKPMALLFLQRGVDATVSVAHSRTDPLSDRTREADVVVAAAGVPELVTADMVAEGATVVDVGINRTDEGGLVGDVAFDEVEAKAEAITPVPGGVGPLTRAFLLVNVVRCACKRRGLPAPEALHHVLPTGLGPDPS
jgi:methylenetetrahydrofolate dehydrogenase (NADP+)/methenyltetrahydrofolate cyclohydrolase